MGGARGPRKKVDGKDLHHDAKQSEYDRVRPEDFRRAEERIREEAARQLPGQYDKATDVLRGFEEIGQRGQERIKEAGRVGETLAAVTRGERTSTMIGERLGIEHDDREVSHNRKLRACALMGIPAALLFGATLGVVVWQVLAGNASPDPAEEEERKRKEEEEARKREEEAEEERKKREQETEEERKQREQEEEQRKREEEAEAKRKADEQAALDVPEALKNAVQSMLDQLNTLLDQDENALEVQFFWQRLKLWMQEQPSWGEQAYVFYLLGSVALGDTPEEAVIADGFAQLTAQYEQDSDMLALLDTASTLKHGERAMTRKEQLGSLFRFAKTQKLEGQAAEQP